MPDNNPSLSNVMNEEGGFMMPKSVKNFATVRRLNPLANVLLLLTAFVQFQAYALDRNNNSFDDFWELYYTAASLAPDADTDNDDFSNLAESMAGTDPRDASSRPFLSILRLEGRARVSWNEVAGKKYQILAGTNLFDFTHPINPGPGGSHTLALPEIAAQFFRLGVGDQDSDGDGFTDYQERLIGFSPKSKHSDRFLEEDGTRIATAFAAPSIVSIAVLDPWMSERWAEPGLVAVRRKGGVEPINVVLELAGTASHGEDYTSSATTNILIPLGKREVWIELRPLADSVEEGVETVVLTLKPGPGYSLSANQTVTLNLENQNAKSGPAVKEAARFLIQAAFGPDQDSADDADFIPENAEELMEIGFEGWIEVQFARPVGKIQPFVDWALPVTNGIELYGDLKQFSWWNRVMGVPRLRPDVAEIVQPDLLRQRVALALSEICVVSDRPEDLFTAPQGMANYYDTLLTHAFGNYRDLLYDVALHPCMGIYLSHVGNKKADPVLRIFPDENFAREIMQLFSIGLWMLNQDGTRQLDLGGQPIPTYDNRDITELARVFTGLAFGGSNVNFGLYPRDFTKPMKMWDEFHDCDPKVLLGGLQLPARTPSSGNSGTAGLADVRAAVDNLFNHPNVGPFIGRQLIQRFITSNPSKAYVARVSAAFDDNGSGVRGDMKAVIKAVLLDPEARDGANLFSVTFGKLREPFLRCVNFARAFNATSQSGIYVLDAFSLDHSQEFLKAPSVFNFFLPTHSPQGSLTAAGLSAPEFQIINGNSSITSPNYFWNSIWGGLHRWGVSNSSNSVQLNLNQELAMVVPAAVMEEDVPNVPAFDPDPLIQRLDLVLTGGRLSPQQFQIIRETLEQIPRNGWQWHREYLRAAIYLVVTSPDFCVLL